MSASFFKKIVGFFRTLGFLTFYARYDSRLRKGTVFGRASSPLGFSARFFSFWFGKYNHNNILLHAKGISKDDDIKISDAGTFNFTRYLEKKLMHDFVRILKLPFSPFSGYVTSGATEANIYAMWVAREWARFNNKDSGNNKIYWIIPDNAHYSIRKALQLLDVYHNSDNEVVIIKTDSSGGANLEEIIGHLKRIRDCGNSPIVLPLTVMTTECGAIDPVREVNDFIIESKIDNVFFHIDAAFSGLLLPYLEEYDGIFSLKSLYSISIDFSKATGGPVGAGAVIFNSGLEEYISTHAPYLSANDQTLSGSRKGADVIAMYGMLSVNGSSGIRKDILNALEKTRFLAEEMARIDFIELLYEPKLNYIVFYFSDIDKKKEEKVRNVLTAYSISSSMVKLGNEEKELFKIIMRPDHTYGKIKEFIGGLKSV
jgi:glutamate/tyrosine decarboxylase-like PLP-dependent enzyme